MSGHAAALPYAIGVEALTSKVSASEMAQACAAVQQQATRDLAPAWHVGATVQAFPEGRTPAGYWRVTLEDGLDEPGALGFHDDDHRQPFARVDASQGDWPVTLSHEVVEMLVDPFGARLWVYHTDPGERVRVLIEACDPPENATYLVDGVPVSDFVLPAYYRHRKRRATVPLTHLDEPLAAIDGIGLGLAPGGYVSWMDSGQRWHQATWFSGKWPQVTSVGRIDTAGGARSPRSVMDELARRARAAA